jgi:hypothetical protein
VTPISIAKLALTLAGIVVFLLGIQAGNAMLRWTGIGLVAMAFLLRFADRPGARPRHGAGGTTDSTEGPEA